MTSDSGTQLAQDTAPVNEAAMAALSIVSKELSETLRQAHVALEDSVEGSGGSAALLKCAELLHEARGALRVCQVYGAALLAEEMESICEYLAGLRPGKGREDGLSALTRAMVQLPSYIESLLGGGRDIALVLLPLLNDLRAARGQPLLSEGTLLLLNLSPRRKSDVQRSSRASGVNPAVTASKLRPKFQLALLGWLNGANPEMHLDNLSRVIAELEGCATREDMYQLWWIAGGVLESLRNGGLETSISLKRLMGQTDRQIKRLIDMGDTAFDAHPVEDLLNNLLYYVARSTTSGERVSEIRSAFNLSELLPGDEQVEFARESLSAPSIKLMKTVAAAIKEDLGKVKDVLDIYVRTGMKQPADLVPQLELLKKISDTLGVLGLGGLRGDIDGEIGRLKKLVEEKSVPEQQVLIDIASTLLRVEDSLDQQLVRLISPVGAAGPPVDEHLPGNSEYQEVTEAVLRESIINLARVKETISEAVAQRGDSRSLDSVPALLRGIKAALLMLDKSRAVSVVDRIGKIIDATLTGGAIRLQPREMDRLADAIVSVEYYMETLMAGRREPWYMLDNAEACLDVLGPAMERQPEEEVGEEILAATTIVEPALKMPETGQASTEVLPLSVMAPGEERIDPELLELFIEEAKEEVASIAQNLPQWQSSSDDMEALITVRRSFHTLKGSGRMVGAERIGEYAWAIENLLNRLINHTLQCTPPMMDFVIAAAAVVPELIEELEAGTPVTADVNLFVARANAFADGDPNAAVLELSPVAGARAKDQPPALEMDPVLLDIFSKETESHLATLDEYIAACEEGKPPFTVTDKLYRACHTLHGSANTANVDRGVKVSAALNRFVRRVHDCEAGFDDIALDAIRDAVVAIRSIVADINQPDRERKDFASLIAHLNTLCDAIEAPAEREEDSGAFPAPDLPQEEEIEEEEDYDAEIAAIFCEEATELLEAADRSLSVWGRDKNSQQHVAELKRVLHTLKGGARMAGIKTMGNLSHEVETLLAHIEDGRLESTEKVDAMLQASIDELHRMRDAVISGQQAGSARELEQQIRHVTLTGEVGEPKTIKATTAKVPETVEEEAAVETVAAESELEQPKVQEEAADTEAEALTQEAEESPADAVETAATEEEAPLEELAAADEGVEEAPAEEVAAEEEEEPAHDVEEDAEEPEAGDEAAEEEGEEAAEAEPEDELEDKREPAKTVMPIAAAPPVAEVKRFPSRGRVDSRQEFARINADLLEDLLNAAGEISIYHSRLSQQVSSIEFNLEELEQTVARLRGQLRKLEIETEAQIMHSHQETLAARDFDPLELDRYSNIQQLSRALAESANDMASLKDLLKNLTGEAETLLVQQARVSAELQDGLMRTRMVPFDRHVPRLTRLVRQVASETDKKVELAVEGGSGELDRQVLEKMLPPFEHMLRNAIVHGIESPEERQKSGKPATGRITIRLHREGSEMVIDVADDGAGLNVDAIRSKAYEQGLLQADSRASDNEIMELILKPGFSTAGALTQSAGRGVGMDVVATEVKKLGGSLQIASVVGQGTNFTIRLPFTLAITQALIVRVGEEVYALPLPSIEGVVRIPRAELDTLLGNEKPTYQYGEQTYRFRHLGMYLGGPAANLPEDEASVQVILVRAGEFSAALLTDEMIASREIVVKSAGPQIASIRGIAGATILGDGSIVLILDVGALVRSGAPLVEVRSAAPLMADKRPTALVVDDSITVRRVMERFLQRSGMRVVTAKDGLDAVSKLQDTVPDIILLDIEMPRMDGYEFATHVRNDPRVSDIPIIMITSRVGDKHRARAIEIGVNDYLGKPYQDAQLLDAIERLLDERGIKLQ